jgi:hypothetical protein
MQWLNDKGLKVFSRCPICRGLRRDRRSDNDKVKETRVCTVCGDLFPITNGQAAWFDAREWGYPKKCPKCLKAQKEAAV